MSDVFRKQCHPKGGIDIPDGQMRTALISLDNIRPAIGRVVPLHPVPVPDEGGTETLHGPHVPTVDQSLYHRGCHVGNLVHVALGIHPGLGAVFSHLGRHFFASNQPPGWSMSRTIIFDWKKTSQRESCEWLFGGVYKMRAVKYQGFFFRRKSKQNEL